MHLVYSQSSGAAATPPPLPPGPLLNPAPGYSQWTVIIQQRSGAPTATRPEDKEAKKIPQKLITVTKTGNVRKEDETDETGTKSQSWTLGEYTVTFRQGSRIPTVAIGSAAKSDSAKTDFPGFEWISAKNYTRIEKVLGRDCIIFRGQSGGTADQPSYAAVASVDAETKLPVSLVVGEETRIYQFAQAPQAMLVPPANVQESIKSWQSHIQEAARSRPRPY